MSVRSLQHIALAVPDPAVGRKFYSDFGMEGKEHDKRVVMRCHGRVLNDCRTRAPWSRAVTRSMISSAMMPV